MSRFASIKAICRSKGLYIKDLASTLGVSPTTVSRWVMGLSEPSYENLEKVCATLGVTATDILGF